MMINPNILHEGNEMEILEFNDDEMEMLVRCNNCGQPTKYGMTRMCSGFVGCDNKITINGEKKDCYFDDLRPRVIKYHDSEDPTLRDLYLQGKIYRWRDKADGGIQ